jgi:hypothetical protein
MNKFSTNESTRIITGHVIYNPAYTYKFHLKTIMEVTFEQIEWIKKAFRSTGMW